MSETMRFKAVWEGKPTDDDVEELAKVLHAVAWGEIGMWESNVAFHDRYRNLARAAIAHIGQPRPVKVRFEVSSQDAAIANLRYRGIDFKHVYNETLDDAEWWMDYLAAHAVIDEPPRWPTPEEAAKFRQDWLECQTEAMAIKANAPTDNERKARQEMQKCIDRKNARIRVLLDTLAKQRGTFDALKKIFNNSKKGTATLDWIKRGCLE
jgi:hypothetical protein